MKCRLLRSPRLGLPRFLRRAHEGRNGPAVGRPSAGREGNDCLTIRAFSPDNKGKSALADRRNGAFMMANHRRRPSAEDLNLYN